MIFINNYFHRNKFPLKMGLCETTNKRAKDPNNEIGFGMPPSEIIPQPIEVSNISQNLTNKITNLDSSNNKEVVQNQPFKSNNQNEEPSFEPVPLRIDQINSNYK
jgi:radical SAM superfamily enzyme with C-terminal helix-hairpin-helix motif